VSRVLLRAIEAKTLQEILEDDEVRKREYLSQLPSIIG
jgi:hypothetical protein